MNSKPLAHTHRRQKSVFFLAISLIVAGTTIWILNILGVIPGPWSNVFSALSTSIGLMAALFQRREV